MRYPAARSVIPALVLLACVSAAFAQQGHKLPSKDSLYRGNRLKPDPNPGGAAPVRDISGSWAGNRSPGCAEIPRLTPLGAKLFSLTRPEPAVGTGYSIDPLNICD